MRAFRLSRPGLVLPEVADIHLEPVAVGGCRRAPVPASSTVMRQPHHIEATAPDRYLRRCHVAGAEPALGLGMHLIPLNRGVLLLVGDTAAGRVSWVERAGMALGQENQRRTGCARRLAVKAGFELAVKCTSSISDRIAPPNGSYNFEKKSAKNLP